MSKAFAMPKAVKITARSSSITNSFVNGIIPAIHPTDEEVKRALEILGMSENSVKCAYCGDTCTEWDHFHPLVVDRRPTGYITEINNLVPACGKCNQSKGNSNWEEWMRSDAEKSPKTRKISDFEERINKLREYDCLPKKQINIQEIVGEENWNKHWENCDDIISRMKEAQRHSDFLKNLLNENEGLSKTHRVAEGGIRQDASSLEQTSENDFFEWIVLNGVGESTARNYKSALHRILDEAGVDFDEFLDAIVDNLPKYYKEGEKESLGNVYSGAGRAVVSKLLDYYLYRSEE